MTKKKYVYESNNSGGEWWLTDEDWKNLEKGGWEVEWIRERWLGALAKRASKEFDSENCAIVDFEKITGKNYHEEGCACCGPPHDIEEDWEGGLNE